MFPDPLADLLGKSGAETAFMVLMAKLCGKKGLNRIPLFTDHFGGLVSSRSLHLSLSAPKQGSDVSFVFLKTSLRSKFQSPDTVENLYDKYLLTFVWVQR